jgi:hypothetical protein
MRFARAHPTRYNVVHVTQLCTSGAPTQHTHMHTCTLVPRRATHGVYAHLFLTHIHTFTHAHTCSHTCSHTQHTQHTQHTRSHTPRTYTPRTHTYRAHAPRTRTRKHAACTHRAHWHPVHTHRAHAMHTCSQSTRTHTRNMHHTPDTRSKYTHSNTRTWKRTHTITRVQLFPLARQSGTSRTTAPFVVCNVLHALPAPVHAVGAVGHGDARPCDRGDSRWRWR